MESKNRSETEGIAIIMVPLPAQGHLNQFLHLSHRLTSYDIPVHYVGSTTHNRQAKFRLHGWDPDTTSKIHFHDFKLPHYPSPSPDPNARTNFPAHLQPLFDASLHLRQPVFILLQELATHFRRVILIHDSSISSVAQDVKLIPNAEAYAVLPISTFTTSMGVWQAAPTKPFELDHHVPTSHCFPSTTKSMTKEILEFVLYQKKFTDFQSGKLYNTCREIEGKYVELMERLSTNPNMKHFAIGPFHPVEITKRTDGQRNGCLEWLDKQEQDSVLYISFGSTTTMSQDQISELAEGLERSGQKFIWVVRNADKGDIFAEEDVRNPELPKGYEERVKSRGIVVPEWAPQLEILAHKSVGGFMSHCGWNSCLESISMGVPIVAWPMHSDQPKNALLVTQVLATGTMVKDHANEAEMVTSSEIQNAVLRLMVSEDGLEMRKRAVELGDKVRKSVAKGGTSHKEMELFIAHITRLD